MLQPHFNMIPDSHSDSSHNNNNNNSTTFQRHDHHTTIQVEMWPPTLEAEWSMIDAQSYGA